MWISGPRRYGRGPTHVRGSGLAAVASFSRSWATLATRPHLCIYGNIQDEFCPARMSLNTKLPMRLLS